MQEQIDDKRQILAWGIGERLFGVDIKYCREVDKNKDIVHVPHARKQIAGIVNLRGDVVTVVDLGILLGHEQKAATRQNVIIRLRSRTGHIALRADYIHDVVAVAPDQLEDIPAHLGENEVKFIQAVAMTARGLVVILDPDEILKAV